MFLVANLRSRGGREILPVIGENAEIGIQVIGDVQAEGWLDLMKRVYSTEGIAPCLCGGGSVQPKIMCFVDQTFKNPKITEDARCLIAHYNAGITTWGSNSGVMEAYAVLAPDRIEKRQNGRRMKEDGEPMFTLTGQDRHGVLLCRGMDGVMKGGRIRRLTPRECFRLQGFPDELYEQAASVNSEAQLYRQAGNAVTSTVAFAVAMMLPESKEIDCSTEG